MESSVWTWLGTAFGLVVFNLAWIGAVRDLVRGRGSRGWPQVPGEIVVCEEDSGTEGYGIRIAYRYEVGGRTFQGERLRFGFISFDRKASHRRKLELYPVGTKVAVAVHPGKPELATLEAGNDADTWLMLGGGLLMGAASFAFLLR